MSDPEKTADQKRAQQKKEHIRQRHAQKIAARKQARAAKASPAPAPAPPAKALPVIRDVCAHRSPEPTGKVQCRTCGGNVEVKVFACAVHGTCSLAKKVDGVAGVCQGCTSRVEAK